jgi:transcriptional regulator with XRE-family HTH domain
MTRERGRLFCALLKYWRHRRGLSQLDLALAADVSHRHLSFLETGRARPSRDMVLRLASMLDVPLRDQNALLDAAGFEPAYPEPAFGADLPDTIKLTLKHMFEQHEPYPLVVVNRAYDVLDANRGAAQLFVQGGAPALAEGQRLNLYRMLFDPAGVRPHVVEWQRVARALLSRLHREALARPDDSTLSSLVHELLEYPDVPREWRQPDFTDQNDPTLPIYFRRGNVQLGFLTAITAFSAPQNVTLDEIRIESYFPIDELTRRACQHLAQHGELSV